MYITYVSFRTKVRWNVSFIGKCILSGEYSVRKNLILSLIKTLFQRGDSKSRKKLSASAWILTEFCSHNCVPYSDSWNLSEEEYSGSKKFSWRKAKKYGDYFNELHESGKIHRMENKTENMKHQKVCVNTYHTFMIYSTE